MRRAAPLPPFGQSSSSSALTSSTKAWMPNTIDCRFKRQQKKLNLGDGVRSYNLRLKFTSNAIKNRNAEPAMLAKALSHADLRMLLRH